VPHVEALWVPVVILIEITFSAGVVMGVSALLVHVRDLVQTIPVIVSLGMFLTPVIWPFSKLTAHQQLIYGLFNPVGPVIDNLRRTALLGLTPTWNVLAVAAVGAMLYFFGGYALFRRLEADLADIA
jgi:ABC-type polysaccharide/polyol phosphate export permease